MIEDPEAITDPQREWSVSRCFEGCLHVALGRVTLTLTEDEFHALQHLMRRACQHFHHREPHRRSDVRTH